MSPSTSDRPRPVAKPKLSEQMKRMLRNTAAGLGPYAGLSGRSQSGGAEGTMLALVRRGFMTHSGEITAEGRAAIGAGESSPHADPEHQGLGYMQGRGAA